jgi:hypothetical protein
MTTQRTSLTALALAILIAGCAPVTMRVDDSHPAAAEAATMQLPPATNTLDDDFDPSVAFSDPKSKPGAHPMHHGHHDHGAMKKSPKRPKKKPKTGRHDEHHGHHGDHHP